MMKKTVPNALNEVIETKTKEGFDREDSSRQNEHHSAGQVRFAKDKRKRITRIEKNPREGVKQNSGEESGERRSFNPNFTKDNKLRGNKYEHDRQAPGERYERRERGAGKDGEERRPRDYGQRGREDGYGQRGKDRFPKKEGYRDNRQGKFAGRGGKFQSGKGQDFQKRQRRDTYKDGEYPTFPAPQFDEPIRLNRYLAMSGLSSRREADELIKSGQVTVNGIVVTELGTKIMPTDVVKYNDNVVQGQNNVYILMNKPKGYVTTLDDPHADKTVMDLLKNTVKERVYPVGRLDKNSLGVLLITNDGDMTKKLTHPAYNKKKIYQVSLDKPLTKADMEQITQGIELEDGEIHADAVSYVGESKREVGIEIHSGRNRIVRRIFEHLGYKVMKLDRVYFAGLTKKNLKRGAWRFLSPKEVQILRSGMYE